MDALSDVLRVIRLSGGVFLEAHLSAPWCLKGRISPEDCKAFQVTPSLVIATHFVVSGQMLVQVNDDEPMVVRAGELLLLPHNDVHAFGSDVDVPPFSQPDEVKSKSAGEFTRIELGGGGEATQLLCGYLGSDHAFGPLLSSLPSVLKLDVQVDAVGRVGGELVPVCGESDRGGTSRINDGDREAVGVVVRRGGEPLHRGIAGRSEGLAGGVARSADRARVGAHAREAGEGLERGGAGGGSRDEQVGVCGEVHVLGRAAADAVSDVLANAVRGAEVERVEGGGRAGRVCGRV